MPVQLSSHAQVLVTDRLRAAGCVFAEDEAQLLVAAALTPAALEDMLGRRVAGLPLEQILGWAEFCGLRIAVEPGVFVPRRRTEFLASKAIDLAHRVVGPPVAVDLCCGSGAVAAALADAVSRLELYAADIDRAAVRCARRNIGTAGKVFDGDLYAELPVELRCRVDVLVANAPYVPTGAIGMMRRKPGCMNRRSRSTAVRTDWTSSGGSSRQRTSGWRPGATCWWKPARAN